MQPPEPPPGEPAPPAPEQAPAPQYQSPAYPPAAEPPPAYAPPPYYGGPPAPTPPRRGRGPLLAIIVVVALVVLLAGGYVVAGFAYGQGQANSARNTYNAVTSRENSLIEIFNSVSTHTDSNDPNNPNKDAIAKDKAYYQQLVTQLQSAQPQVESDLSALAAADSKLKENQWLTPLSRSTLDQAARRVEYRQTALSVARTTLVDYAQYAGFNVALLTSFNDTLTFSDAATAHDFVAAAAAAAALKSDITTATGLDKAPGLDPDVDSYMHDYLAVATDLANLLTAAAAGNQAGLTRAEAALTADGKKLDAHDTAAWASTAKSFYDNLTAQYNTANDKANSA